ncbi:heme-binding protein [Thalassoglobus sp. JC818]|uniref:SOUL family heme-binding protein n=1 Tax=Thalassoglobus sp. JC818 TaxID=3232136 RepID=UPI00345977B0
MKTQMFYLIGVGFWVILGVTTWNVTARAGYESAPYEVIEKDGNIEIREYPELVLASTQTNVEARGNDGSFMKLFRYISGDNETNQKIEMTTPVFMEEGSKTSEGSMGFVMPQDVKEAGAPQPRSSDILISTRKGGRFAVIRFSGIMNERKAAVQEKLLRDWMVSREISGEASAERAGYDAPFVPGPLRRNEILIRLKP